MNTATFEANNLRSFIPFMAKDERGSLAIGGTPANGFNQAIIINCNEGVETTCTFKEALNKRMCMLNHWPMDPSEESGTKRPELCRYTLLESIFWSLTIRMKQSDMLKPILKGKVPSLSSSMAFVHGHQ